MSQRVTWKLRRAGDGFEGEIILPAPVAPVAISTKGRNKQEAIARAASVAKSIATNPILSAVLPPGTPLAVEAISQLAKSPTAQTLKKFAGPGAKRLVSALKSIF